MLFLSQEYKEHYKENIRLALPVAIGSAAHMMAGIADSMMVGRISGLQLAASSFANNVFILVFIFGIGMAVGITPLVGKAYGAKDNERCKELLQNALVLNSIIAVALVIIGFSFIPLFKYMGQDPQVIEIAKPYYMILVVSMLPNMIFLTFKQFTDGLSYTKPAMYINIFGNLSNILMNWVLIYGNLGFPKLEIVGAGYATFLSRVFMAIAFIYLFSTSIHYKEFFKDFLNLKVKLKNMSEILRMGIPTGIQFVLEVGAFVAGTMIIGMVGSVSLAAHQIAISLAALTFLTASGFSSAATIRISSFIGQKDYVNMRRAGHSTFFMIWAFMSLAAIIFVLFGRQLASLYVNPNEIEIINIAVELLVIAAFFQIADGTQVNALGALRGLEDVKIPTIITTIAYWLLTIPLCYFLGINLGMGAKGVWYGYLIGLSFAGLFLFIRFEILSKKLSIN